MQNSFKPQRGKFTLKISLHLPLFLLEVSNPNGVNLHLGLDFIIDDGDIVSNPNGVNLHY